MVCGRCLVEPRTIEIPLEKKELEYLRGETQPEPGHPYTKRYSFRREAGTPTDRYSLARP